MAGTQTRSNLATAFSRFLQRQHALRNYNSTGFVYLRRFYFVARIVFNRIGRVLVTDIKWY